MISRTLRTAAGFALAATLVAGMAPRSATAAQPPMYAAYIYDATGKALGQALFTGIDTGGVLVRVDVTGLPPGKHGMHIHEIGSCNTLRDTTGAGAPFTAAGGHFDPQGTSHHLGPDGAGHAGDLPNLEASAIGHARTTIYTSKLSVLTGPNSIVGRSIVIHANPDNYTDAPPLGGSGGRIACGEIGPLRVSLQPSEMSKAPEQVASTVPSKSVFPSGLQIKTNSRSTFQRDDLKISADKMTFDGSSKIMHFQGNVIVVSRTQNIESSSADFNFQTGEIRAEGKVLIQGPKT